MLASLLFDDLQGIDKDFDVTLVSEGPDGECSGSLAPFFMTSWRPIWTLILLRK